MPSSASDFFDRSFHARPSFAVAISMDDDRDAAVAQRLGWLTDEQIQGRKDAADRRIDAPVQR